MKSLLISLMAFLCVLGINATPTGSGTQEDPYVIADGDVYMVDDPVYASFTAPGDGTLTLSYFLGEFYQFNLSSCIRQQNSLTAQFVSFSLANLANIFYPPQFLQ